MGVDAETVLQALRTAEIVLIVAVSAILAGTCLRPCIWSRSPFFVLLALSGALLRTRRLVLSLLFAATGMSLASQAVRLLHPQAASGSTSLFSAWTLLFLYGATRLLFVRLDLRNKLRDAETKIARLESEKAHRAQMDAVSTAVPEWLEVAFAERQRTSVLLPNLPWQPRPAWMGDLPFRDGRIGWYFVYMTNREQRYSLLSEEPIQVKDLYTCIGMGYTQLWVLRKVAHFEGRSRHVIRRGCALAFPKDLRVVVGQHVVFQSPFAKTGHHDTVHAGSREDCMTVAERAALEYGDGFLVAELLVDEFWH